MARLMNYLAANEWARRGARRNWRPGEVSDRNSGNERGCFPSSARRPNRTLDGVWFHHRVSWTPAANNRPRRFYTGEIYDWPRCNSPTETDHRSQINSGKRLPMNRPISRLYVCTRVLDTRDLLSFHLLLLFLQPPSLPLCR